MIKEFAEWLSLTVWDWIAVSVALCSLFVAILSFIIARQTLKSQRQTEENTMPIINKDIQQFLLDEFIVKLLDGYLRILALWNILDDKKYKYYPLEQILEIIKLPSTNIHCELFYKNHTSYRIIEGLIELINEYNVNIDSLNSHLYDDAIKEEVIYKEFRKLVIINGRIAEAWEGIMHLLYGYNEDDKYRIFECFIKDITKDEINKCIFKYHDEDGVYAHFFVEAEKKRRLLVFMEQRTIIYYKEFEDFLIEKK
ncbi:MAG: hypothetical protein IKY01_05375 [Prevotella sp.]|nr:hypothetical protein [Prevotella sp.]